MTIVLIGCVGVSVTRGGGSKIPKKKLRTSYVNGPLGWERKTGGRKEFFAYFRYAKFSRFPSEKAARARNGSGRDQELAFSMLALSATGPPAAKRRAPGLVNFVTALAHHFCLALPAAFTQPGSHLFAEHSKY